jgi:Ca-activated chloride channel family protein
MIGFEDFHFLRPLWLLAIAVLVPLIWRTARARRSAGEWQRVCDPELLEHLLVPGAGRAIRWPSLALALAWIAGCVAMAGPSWERLPQTAYRAPTQTVAVLDLSESMLARDVTPSRLARARFELLDLLDHVDGAVGLVIFSDEPYAVTPLTDDPRVIAELVPTLSPDLMPGRGKRLDRAIDRATELLEQAGATRGRVVVLSDGLGNAPEAARDSARRSADAGYQVSALGLGEGAVALESLVRLGGGHYADQTADDSDIEKVLAASAGSGDLLGFGGASEASVGADVWRDEGPWLLLIPLLLAPFAFRKGWTTALSVLFLIGLHPPRAEASQGTLFQRADERGAAAYSDGRHAEAATLFEDPEWRAAAQYRTGDYESAVASLQGREDPTSLYNLGNALARGGQLEPAITAYDRTLEAMPDHEDAAFNRELVKRLLEEQQQEPEPQESEPQQDGESEGSGESDPASQNDPQESDGSGDSEASPAANGSDSGGEDAEPAGGGEQAPSDPENPAADDSKGEGDSESESGAVPKGDSGESAGSDSAQERSAADNPSPGAGGEEDEGMDSDPQTAGAGASEARDEGSDPKDTANAGSPGDADEASESDAMASTGVDPGSEASPDEPPTTTTASAGTPAPISESDQEIEQWLNRVPDDPGGLLREKLRRRYAEQRYRAQPGTTRPPTPGGRIR